METMIRRCVLRRLIWVCTVCQLPFYGSPDYNGLNGSSRLALWSSCWWKGCWLLCFTLVCGLCTVCPVLFALPFCVIGWLWQVIVAIPGHLLNYFSRVGYRMISEGRVGVHFFLPMNVYKIAEWVANSVDPDQIPRFAASDLCLHCLL